MAHQLTPLRRLLRGIGPAQSVVLAFAVAVGLDTALLALPAATARGDSAGPLTSLFTATSAVCVTGLKVVETGTYWSGFGQAVILVLIQVGGFGVMTLASLLALLVVGRLRLGLELRAGAETGGAGVGEVRGEPSAAAFHRRLPPEVLRHALAVVVLALALVVTATVALLATVAASFEAVLFEVVSAFGNVGLSMGLTGELPASGQLVLVALMFLGRVGPLTLVSALALRERPHRFRFPAERPVVG